MWSIKQVASPTAFQPTGIDTHRNCRGATGGAPPWMRRKWVVSGRHARICHRHCGGVWVWWANNQPVGGFFGRGKGWGGFILKDSPYKNWVVSRVYFGKYFVYIYMLAVQSDLLRWKFSEIWPNLNQIDSCWKILGHFSSQATLENPRCLVIWDIGIMLTRNRSRLRENMQRHVTCLTCIVTWQIVPFLAGTLTLKSQCRGWHGIVPCPNDCQQVSISDNYICSKLFFDVNNPWTTFNAYLHKGIIIIETLTFGHHAVLYAPGLF